MVDSLAVRTNGHQLRKDFAKIAIQIGIPDLIEIQKRSYERFLQKETSPERREEMGLQSAFTSVFPIDDYNETSKIEFIDYSIGQPKYDASIAA
jgi:DNA-directed RNA polymerase subunit beta